MHEFINAATEADQCDKCLFRRSVNTHKVGQEHHFVNIPGISACSHTFENGDICASNKDHPIHIKTSDQDSTYRKPLGLRFDLIPPLALRRLAAIYEEGVQVYGEGRYIWEPMPHSNVIKHLMNHLNLAQLGDRTEDHWAKIAWAAFTMMVYEELSIGDANLARYGVTTKEIRSPIKWEVVDPIDKNTIERHDWKNAENSFKCEVSGCGLGPGAEIHKNASTKA